MTILWFLACSLVLVVCVVAGVAVYRMPTLRDRMAMAALAGLLADTRVRDTDDGFARAAYRMAGAMLAARKRL